MPGGLSVGQEISNGSSIVTASTSTGVSVTPSATSSTKGSFTQLIAATSFDACWMAVQFQQQNTSRTCFDIAVGASGLEKIIASNLFALAGSSSDTPVPTYFFPVSIPAGSRISARSATASASGAASFISASIFDGALTQPEGASNIENLNTVITAGTSIVTTTLTASGSTNTKGSYSSIIAATTKDYAGIAWATDVVASMPASGTNYLFDIAVGPSGVEKIIVPDQYARYENGAVELYPFSSTIFWVPIPAGSSIRARSQASVASAVMGLTVFGIS